MGRRVVRHPEALALAGGHVGKPVRPLRQVWYLALVNRDPKRWEPRGHEATRETALERVDMLLAADHQGLYDGGWVRQAWAS